MNNEEVLYDAYFVSKSLEDIFYKFALLNKNADAQLGTYLGFIADEIRDNPYFVMKTGLACYIMRHRENKEQVSSLLTKYECLRGYTLEEIYNKRGESFLEQIEEDFRSLQEG